MRVYVVGLVVLVAVVALVNVIYQRQTALVQARQSALASTGFAARTAAREVGADLGTVRTQISALAASPQIARTFLPGAPCSLQFGGEGAFTTGHIDIVGKDGTVACSSLPAGGSPGYRGARWLAAALRAPLLAGPALDTRTGQPVAVTTAPVPGRGLVAAALNLAPVGPALASTLSGPRHLEFVITAGNGAVVLARSAGPRAWVGKPVAGTPFGGASGHAEHRDLTGTPRLYSQAAVPGTGWVVFAGESTAQAYAAANRLSNQQIAITLVGLAVFLAAALVLYRRITRPIAGLSAGVRTATARLPADPVPVAGPAEVSALAETCNRLISAANRELDARSRLAATAESSSDAIVGLTLDGAVTDWNAGAERMFGYSRQEMVGGDVSGLVVPGRDQDLAAFMAGIRAGERVVEAEAACRCKDNGIINVSYSLAPVHDGSGAVTGTAMVARDVTGRHRAEADRRALEHRLAQSERLESLGQLAAGVAHDFNNLLAAIMNYAGFVAEETTGQPAVQADVDQISRAAERGARLTKQLLIFGRREPARPQPLDLNAVVTEMRDLLSRSVGGQVELVVRAAPGLPVIEADRGQIEQVLLNLAINARDAMPAGGTLTILTRPAELGEGYAAAHPGARPGHYAELAVTDTGTGIPKEIIDRVFEPLFTTKPADRGTGLGLSTVYGIVTGAGGSMTVESAEGAGTAFRLYFPATVAPAAAPADRMPEVQGNGQTILVVDDEPAVLAATARMLRQNGYTTLEADTADQALRQAARHEFQLLLTDSVLPGRSGQALAEVIAGLRPGVPVVYMSGNVAQGARPADDAQPPRIAKPFTQQTLLHSIHIALRSGPATHDT